MRLEQLSLGSVLGRGGICVVQEARGERGARYAVKRLAPQFARMADYQARLAREYEVLDRIHHPNVVRAERLLFREGELFLVLEHLDAEPLDAILHVTGPLPIHQAAALFYQAASGLAAAHAAGVLHRDIKPSNMMVARGRSLEERAVKLIDFGAAIAPADPSLGARLTGEAAVIGTPEYMPLESLTCAEPPSSRADVYGLGVTMYELLTARVPREGTFGQIIQQWILSRPPGVRDLRRDVPPALAAVIERALAVEPRARYEDATDMLMSLTDAMRSFAA